MTVLVPILLFGWMPAVLLLFLLLPARRAVIVSILFAWLFLPMASYPLRGLPDYSKMTATTYAIAVGIVLFDARRLLSFRFRWFDVPMLIWCACPFVSSMTNGLGAYDGVSHIFKHVVLWGLPYLVGRLYFADVAAQRELAIGVFAAGLLYVPFCLYELVMSPQLHHMVYGYYQHRFHQHVRSWGYRPMVFMQHGLMVGLWMAAATVAAAGLYVFGGLKRFLGVPMIVVVGGLAAMTVLCKAIGAIILMSGGFLVLLAVKVTRSPWPLVVLALAPSGYMIVRGTDLWSARQLVEAVAPVAPDRAQSLEHRIDAEDLLVARAMERPFFGWGTWNRNRVYDEQGKDMTGRDALWVITIGTRGLVGLVALTAAFVLPTLCLARRVRRPALSGAAWAPVVSLLLLLLLYQVDCLLNAMINPIYTVIMGGLTGMMATGLRPQAARLGRPASAGAVRAHAEVRYDHPA